MRQETEVPPHFDALILSPGSRIDEGDSWEEEVYGILSTSEVDLRMAGLISSEWKKSELRTVGASVIS